MTLLPDWLVERAALDEVPAASKQRVAQARDLEARVAALRAANAAELASHPAAPALAQIQARVARLRIRRRARTIGALGVAIAAAAAVLFVARVHEPERAVGEQPEVIRVKGAAHLVVFRQVAGGDAERLERDAEVRAGDVLQLRYNAGHHGFGVIASIDGAGAVTLHFPAAETAPTAINPAPTTLPDAYALDAAPKFERFFFITSDAPIDVGDTLARLRAFAQRDNAADASLELPTDQDQWSLRLRKPNP